MKKLLYLLIFWLFPLMGFATIDEYKTDVYFANGILTKKMDAISNTDLLEKSIKKKSFVSFHQSSGVMHSLTQ